MSNSAVPRLFYIDPTTKDVVIDDDTLLLCKAFNTLWSKLYKVKGDHDGREKKYNKLLFAYVYYMCSYRSIISGIKDLKIRHEKAIKLLGLDDDYKPDALVNDAMKLYIEIQDEFIPINRSIISLKQGLMLGSYAVDTYTNQMGIVIDAMNALTNNLAKQSAAGAGITSEMLTDINQANILLQTNINNMLSLSAKLPNAIKELGTLFEILMKEEVQARELQGGRKKGRREDPK